MTMMQKPAIRFEGFSENWVAQRLGELYVRAGSGGTPDSSNDSFYQGDIPFLNISDMNGRYIDKTEKLITKDGLKSSTAWIVPKGSISLAMYASVGKVGILNIDAATSQAFFNMVFDNDVTRDYLYTVLEKAELNNGWEKLISTGTQKNLNAEKIKQVSLLVPSLPEQQAIGALFAQLDRLIGLQQEKCRKLRHVKQACLEKMFPQDGRDVPEIRFKGFTGAWEQRKLGDVGKTYSGVGFPDAEQGGVSGIPFFKVSDMNISDNKNEMVRANNYVTTNQIVAHGWSPVVELPAIFFAKVGAAVMLNRKRLCRIPFLMDNNTMAYSLYPMKWDADFAKSLFETIDLTSLVQLGALPSYSGGDVEAICVSMPSFSEQQAIGAFFKHLDDQISLHQQKLDKLQDVKKALLEKMMGVQG